MELFWVSTAKEQNMVSYFDILHHLFITVQIVIVGMKGCIIGIDELPRIDILCLGAH